MRRDLRQGQQGQETRQDDRIFGLPSSLKATQPRRILTGRRKSPVRRCYIAIRSPCCNPPRSVLAIAVTGPQVRSRRRSCRCRATDGTARLGQLRHRHRHRRRLRRSPQLRHGRDRAGARGAGFSVGIIAQPDWNSADDFARLGRPNLYFGVTGGNMDSMVSRYTAERRLRSDDAYTPGGEGGRRPDRAVIVIPSVAARRFATSPVVIGGIEASLRRIAHFDYWQEKVRRSVLLDAKADMLLFGNAERAIVDLSHRLAGGEAIADITDLRHRVRAPCPAGGLDLIDSTGVDMPGRSRRTPDPTTCPGPAEGAIRRRPAINRGRRSSPWSHTRARARGDHQADAPAVALRACRDDPVLYAHASRAASSPTRATRALVQRHGDREVWINPPPLRCAHRNWTGVFDLPTSGAAPGRAAMPGSRRTG